MTILKIRDHLKIDRIEVYKASAGNIAIAVKINNREHIFTSRYV